MGFEREEVRMKEPMAALVCQRGPYPSLCRCRTFVVERLCDDDLSDAFCAESRKSQKPGWQIFIRRLDTEALLDEAVNPNRLRIRGIQFELPQLIGTNRFYLFRLVEGLLTETTGLSSESFHPFWPRSRRCRNLSSSSGLTPSSTTLRSANPIAGLLAEIRFNSWTGGRASCFLRSSSKVPRSCAITFRTSSDGYRLPSSMSDMKGADTLIFFANSLSERSFCSRSSRIRSPRIFIATSNVSLHQSRIWSTSWVLGAWQERVRAQPDLAF